MAKSTCFISYSHEKQNKKKFNALCNMINNSKKLDNYSERDDKSKLTDESIWSYLYKRISGATITIVLLTRDLFYENKDKINYKRGSFLESGWIYNEICASLKNKKNNSLNGIICVFDEAVEKIIVDGNNIILDRLPEILAMNAEYIVWARYDDFMNNHLSYINSSKQKRLNQIKLTKYKINYGLHKR